VDQLRESLPDGVDGTIAARFDRALDEAEDVSASLADLVEVVAGAGNLGDDSRQRAWTLIGRLRSLLARASVDVLQPDLVILDEFQRFRDLLDPTTPAGELAHLLFEHP